MEKKNISNDLTEYHVVCSDCRNVLTPTVRSSLWWRAKKHAENGFMDAYLCAGEECGCVKKQIEPNAPYRLFGYTDDCRNFDIPFKTFTSAVQKFLKLKQENSIMVFIRGVSPSVESKLTKW